MDFMRYAQRRKLLMNNVLERSEQLGPIFLFAGFERDCASFRQDSSFYYYTGLTEPGLVAVLDAEGEQTLYIPNCGAERDKWMVAPVELTQENAKNLGFDAVKPLGKQCVGYQFHPFFPQQEYDFLLAVIQECVRSKKALNTLAPSTPHSYIDQRLLLERIKSFVPGISELIKDISPIVAEQRRKKDKQEIELLYKAIGITGLAQEAAAQAIAPQVNECEVQASLEYMMTGSCARIAFPSIVASGKNSTILHYHLNSAPINKGDVVVVDIGAEYQYYCADITRTYPASGKFSKRQRELYDLVLETQEYVASIAKPGMWLNNKEQADQSLNHLARAYLQKKGYDKYFLHGIGHFLGLDVHDVGDSAQPLQTGDVITIEPGIYIRDESIGIRIEDDYWIVDDGVICLSEDIPKGAEEMEKAAAKEK